MKRLFTFLPLMLLVLLCSAQEDNHSEEIDHEEKRFRIALGMINTHVPAGGAEAEQAEYLIVPTWGLDLEYKISKRFALGVHSDIEITRYVVKDMDGVALVRENPFVVSFVVQYNPWKHLVLYAGPGYEIETHRDFYLTRLGVAYEIEIQKHFDISPGVIYDIRSEGFNSFAFGLSIGKRF